MLSHPQYECMFYYLTPSRVTKETTMKYLFNLEMNQLIYLFLTHQDIWIKMMTSVNKDRQ